MVAYKIKFGTVPSAEVTKSDFTIGFSVVELPGNKAWWMDFYEHTMLISEKKA